MNKLFKFEISANGTADKVNGLEFVPDKQLGKGFRIEKAWISFPDSDAEVTGDTKGFQISTKSLDGDADLLDIDSEYEVYTYKHVVEALGTNGNYAIKSDMNLCIPIPDISGTVLKSGKKYFFNQLCTGQDAADVECKVKLLAQYVNPKNVSADELDDWHYNTLS